MIPADRYDKCQEGYLQMLCCLQAFIETGLDADDTTLKTNKGSTRNNHIGIGGMESETSK